MMDGCVEYIKHYKDYLKKQQTAKKPETIEKARKKAEQPHFDPFLPDFSKEEILENEKRLIGFYASGHPLEKYMKDIDE